MCGAVLAEACSFFVNPRPVPTLVARGDLLLDFNLADEMPKVLALVTKHADQRKKALGIPHGLVGKRISVIPRKKLVRPTNADCATHRTSSSFRPEYYHHNRLEKPSDAHGLSWAN